MHIKRVRSFRKAVYFQLIFMIVITAGILGYLWIHSEYTNFSQESKKEEKEFISNQQTIIKNEVNSQIDYIQYMRVQAEDRLKENVKNRTYEAYDIAMNI
ncbi:hypothetical protein CLVI_02290 [Clostridium vincentii]|uniref:Double Cache domain-containing protein n=1 Tax=Clostridium vincentii TaxID=52704 RepID=A0A2T0BKE2_9CLOT|nr:hypothetical protein CLVI_02290 [Clostridium vincentii]